MMNGPIAGKNQNCQEFATFEPLGSSSSAALCHGGKYQERYFNPCPVRAECKQATTQRAQDQHRHLPILNPAGVPIASQNLSQSWERAQQARQLAAAPPISPRAPIFRAPTFSSTIPAATAPQGPRYDQPTTFPTPIIPPDHFPEAMRTPYASATPVYGGGTSPTFLPGSGENVFERLTKNMVQGALSAAGWHIFDFTRAVDLFR